MARASSVAGGVSSGGVADGGAGATGGLAASSIGEIEIDVGADIP